MPRHKFLPKEFSSWEAAADFWDKHSLADYWHDTLPIQARIDLREIRVVFETNGKLARQIHRLARRRRIKSSTLLSRWFREGLRREAAR